MYPQLSGQNVGSLTAGARTCQGGPDKVGRTNIVAAGIKEEPGGTWQHGIHRIGETRVRPYGTTLTYSQGELSYKQCANQHTKVCSYSI